MSSIEKYDRLSEEEDEVLVENIPDDDNEQSDEDIKYKLLPPLLWQDLKELILKTGCIIYFIIGISLSIAMVCKELDPNQANGSGLMNLFLVLVSICVFGNSLLNIYNHYVNSRLQTTAITVKTNILLYAVLIPLMIIAVIFWILQIVQRLMFPEDTDAVVVLLIFFYLLFLISVVILMVDGSKIEAMNASSIFNRQIHKSAMIVTIVGLFVVVVLQLTFQQVAIFKKTFQDFFNVTYYTNSSGHLVPALYIHDNATFPLLKKLKSFFAPSHVAFVAISITSLIGSLMYDPGDKVESSSSSLSVASRGRPLKLPFPALFIGVIVVIMPIISVPIIKLHSDKEAVNYLVFYLIPCVTYLFGIGLSIIQIREIRLWPASKGNKNIFSDKCLIWIGGMGQIIFVLNYLSMSVERIRSIYTEQPQDLTTKIFAEAFLLINLGLLVVQIALQSNVVRLILVRTPMLPEVGSVAAKYCPSVGLFCLNVGCTFITIYMAPEWLNEEFGTVATDLLHKGLHVISNSFSLIYRLHGCIFFGILVNKVHL